jgi:hypothetical protein
MKQSGRMAFLWPRLIGGNLVPLGNGFFGQVYLESSGLYFGLADDDPEHCKDREPRIQTVGFDDSQGAGDDMVAQVQKTIPKRGDDHEAN